MSAGSRTEALLRELAPQVLGTLVRRHGQFDACEDAVQEALVAAALRWPDQGVPEDPRAWLSTVASRRLVDARRSDNARHRREQTAATLGVPGEPSDQDNTLTLLFLCCHPALSEPSQLALTLRAVGGLTTAEIAKAFLVPEATMAQRISRAKQSIKNAGLRFDLPAEPERAERLRVVLHVLYLVFNEGYTTSTGDAAQRADLTAEAIRLTRLLHRLAPLAEVAGLLALMLLTRMLGTAAMGHYQLQAAIAAVHDEAASAEQTDWPQILALYDVLEQVSQGPVITLNRAVAVAMVHGPLAGLAVLATIEADERMTQTHRLEAVRCSSSPETRPRPARPTSGRRR